MSPSTRWAPLIGMSRPCRAGAGPPGYEGLDVHARLSRQVGSNGVGGIAVQAVTGVVHRRVARGSLLAGVTLHVAQLGAGVQGEDDRRMAQTVRRQLLPHPCSRRAGQAAHQLPQVALAEPPAPGSSCSSSCSSPRSRTVHRGTYTALTCAGVRRWTFGTQSSGLLIGRSLFEALCANISHPIRQEIAEMRLDRRGVTPSSDLSAATSSVLRAESLPARRRVRRFRMCLASAARR